MKAIVRMIILVVFAVLLIESSKVLLGQQSNKTDYNQKQTGIELETENQSIDTPSKSKSDFVLRDYPSKLLEETFFPIVDKK